MRNILLKTGLRFFNGSERDKKIIITSLVGFLCMSLVILILASILVVNSVKDIYGVIKTHPSMTEISSTATYFIDNGCRELNRSQFRSFDFVIELLGCEKKGEEYVEYRL